MGKLKPIGSEKLTGQDKINRILEIARFKEVVPSSINETERSEYNINLPDGNRYEIVKEKQGYIVKRTISESTSEYIEPMKNRKYYSSYSQALKRLNLLAAEVNRITENEESISLFGEDKKYVLKTPEPKETGKEISSEVPPSAPPPVPSPSLPPSPITNTQPQDDTEMGSEEDMSDTESSDSDLEVDDEFEPSNSDNKDDDQVSFKTIQKLTGKLTQKIRTLDNQEGMTSEDIKYVINMVLSSVNLNELSDDDREDILSKFEEVDETDDFDSGEETDFESVGDDEEMEPSQEEEVGEMSHRSIMDSIFSESKIDSILSKYFEYTKKEILEQKEKNISKFKLNKYKMNEVSRLSETLEQKLASSEFLNENRDYNFIGKTNKKNLVFEHKGIQVKITPNGFVI